MARHGTTRRKTTRRAASGSRVRRPARSGASKSRRLGLAYRMDNPTDANLGHAYPNVGGPYSKRVAPRGPYTGRRKRR